MLPWWLVWSAGWFGWRTAGWGWSDHTNANHPPSPPQPPKTPQLQIIISGNKEAVISEKEMNVGFGCTVVTSYSELVDPSQFATFDAFMARVQQLWDQEWRATMSADAAGAGSSPGGCYLVLCTSGRTLPCVFD
jgi:hypothetical protein